MKQRLRVALIVVVSVVSACTNRSAVSDAHALRSVTYRNQTIPLSRAYSDFHAYRDDPNNLPSSEIPHVAQLVRSAPVPDSFASRQTVDDTFFKLMFPGYGLSIPQPHDPVLLYAIEIPQMSENRWIALVERNSVWVVVDDFLWPISAGDLNQAKHVNGKLVYLDRAGKVLREK